MILITFEKEYLTTIIEQFKHFKERAEKGIEQLSEMDLHWKSNEESNSIAIIIKHLSGNMHSRWVDFLTADGEKAYRNRDLEFVDRNESKKHLMQIWEDGWPGKPVFMRFIEGASSRGALEEGWASGCPPLPVSKEPHPNIATMDSLNLASGP